MMISTRLFKIMEDKGITQAELSRLTGISTKTISDWRKKGTNPGADKIMSICKALEIKPETLLSETEAFLTLDNKIEVQKLSEDEDYLVDCYRGLPESTRKRLIAYASLLAGINNDKKN